MYTDLFAYPTRLFWHRDLGLLTKAFRDLGHEAWLVVHPATDSCRRHTPPDHQHPVLWATPSQVRNPSWWQNHQPDLVILGLWTRPKYDPIRRAALSATSRVVERADSDGMRTASCGWKTYARRRYDYFRDRTFSWGSVLSVNFSFLYSFASLVATPWIELRLARSLDLLPVLTTETPEATWLWKGLAAKLGTDPARIYFVPHPIQTDLFVPNPAVKKQNRVIAVGRWESYQKNLPLLLKTLVSFLNQNPDWSSLVLGTGLPTCAPHSQIQFSPPLDPRDLARQMQSSKIFLSTSHYESFGLAAAEAISCGCLYVGPPGLVSTAYFRSLAKIPAPPEDNLMKELEATAALLEKDHLVGAEAAHRIRTALAPEKIAGDLLALA